jgi:hypothetical protein
MTKRLNRIRRKQNLSSEFFLIVSNTSKNTIALKARYVIKSSLNSIKPDRVIRKMNRNLVVYLL